MDVSFGRPAVVGALHDLVLHATTGKAPQHSANPLLFAAQEALSVGWHKHEKERDLSKFLETYVRDHGSISTLTRPAHVAPAAWNGYLVQKAATLLAAGRKPSDVIDLTILARGTVDGQGIADRTLFAQRFKPQGTPNGTTVVVAPGFLETGRSYAEQALAMSAKGYEVLVFDQQWAGLSSGRAGRIDRGFGIARDVAAVAAKAAESGNKVVLMGTSMGGGAGVYGAIHLTEHDIDGEPRIKLAGPQMPKGLPAILQAPYFETSPGIINDTLRFAGRIPGVRELPLPVLGIPFLSSDPVTLHKLASHAVIEGITGRAQGFHASTDDLAKLRAELPLLAPTNRIYVIQGRQDALARFSATADIAALVGPNMHIEPLKPDTSNHVIEETPGQQDEIFKGLAWVARAA